MPIPAVARTGRSSMLLAADLETLTASIAIKICDYPGSAFSLSVPMRTRGLAGARALLEQMCANGVQPNEVTWTHAACPAKRGRTQCICH